MATVPLILHGNSHRESAGRDGILPVPERALHIELPRVARREWREVYTAILSDVIIPPAARPPSR